MPEVEGMTAEDLRANADQLRAVLGAIRSGDLESSGRQSGFIAGALRAVELMQANEGRVASGEPSSREHSGR
jgi:hypothetical protein